MMCFRRLFPLLALLLGLSSCQRNSFRIEGTVSGLADGDSLVVTLDPLVLEPADTIVIADGRFSYQGVADTANLCLLFPLSDPYIRVFFFNEPGTITMSIDTEGKTTVGGTESNEAWQQLTDVLDDYDEKMQALVETFYDEEPNEADMKAKSDYIERLEQEKNEWVRQFAKDNAGNAAGIFLKKYSE